MKVATLYVDLRGVYSEVEDVELWGLPDRDAREYAGPWPVVAHPPCARWCRVAGLVESRYPELKRGEDDGEFAAALEVVRTWGGVLEHPAFSDAFTAYGLPIPASGQEGWQRGICGGWVCYVEQGRYGHPAKKATWLYAYGLKEPPPLRWGLIPNQEQPALVSWCSNKIASSEKRPRVGKSAAAATPPEFRDVLLEIARKT